MRFGSRSRARRPRYTTESPATESGNTHHRAAVTVHPDRDAGIKVTHTELDILQAKPSPAQPGMLLLQDAHMRALIGPLSFHLPWPRSGRPASRLAADQTPPRRSAALVHPLRRADPRPDHHLDLGRLARGEVETVGIAR
jgi:hypothetical protein